MFNFLFLFVGIIVPWIVWCGGGVGCIIQVAILRILITIIHQHHDKIFKIGLCALLQIPWKWLAAVQIYAWCSQQKFLRTSTNTSTCCAISILGVGIKVVGMELRITFIMKSFKPFSFLLLLPVYRICSAVWILYRNKITHIYIYIYIF